MVHQRGARALRQVHEVVVLQHVQGLFVGIFIGFSIAVTFGCGQSSVAVLTPARTCCLGTLAGRWCAGPWLQPGLVKPRRRGSWTTSNPYDEGLMPKQAFSTCR